MPYDSDLETGTVLADPNTAPNPYVLLAKAEARLAEAERLLAEMHTARHGSCAYGCHVKTFLEAGR